MEDSNYRKRCGCICKKGELEPWYACVKHARQELNPGDVAKKKYWLYSLKLEDDMYYVGITARKNPYVRIREHSGWLGAQWTKKHRPITILEIQSLGEVTKQEAETAEQKLTLELMEMYGYKKVRGGELYYSGGYTKFLNRYFRDYQWSDFLWGTITVGCLLLIVVILVAKTTSK